MSRVADLKASVLTGLGALPALSGVDVRYSRSIRAPFRTLSRKRGVFLTYGKWTAAPVDRQYAGQAVSKKRHGFDRWDVVVISESYRNAADAFTQAGGADELLDGVMTLRGVNLAPPGWTHGPYILEPDDAELVEPDDPLTQEGGGTVGYLVTFTSEAYSL